LYLWSRKNDSLSAVAPGSSYPNSVVSSHGSIFNAAHPPRIMPAPQRLPPVNRHKPLYMSAAAASPHRSSDGAAGSGILSAPRAAFAAAVSPGEAAGKQRCRDIRGAARGDGGIDAAAILVDADLRQVHIALRQDRLQR